MMSYLKQEPIDISDSDSDRLEIEERPRFDSFSSSVDDVAVRRSARRRRTSSKLSGDFVVTAEDRRTTTVVALPEKKRRVETTKWVPPRPSRTAEPVEPDVLLAYVERTKRSVKPGDYAVKLAAGPDQFVTIDGAEYLRGLGYDFDIDSSKFEKKEKVSDNDDDDDDKDSVGSQEAGDLVGITPKSLNDETKELKEVVDEPDQFSSASAYSTEDERRSVSSNNSSKEIDVGTPDDQGVVPFVNTSYLIHPKSKSKAAKPLKSNAFPQRQDHNLMEQARRRELASLFSYLKSIVTPSSPESSPKVPKVKILIDATDVVAEVKQECVKLTMEKHQLEVINRRLIEQKCSLDKLLKQKETKKRRKSKKNKSVINL